MSVLGDIVNSSFSEYDSLPVSAKLLLAARLLGAIGNDFADLRGRFFHTDGDTVTLPRLNQDYTPDNQYSPVEQASRGRERHGLVDSA
jgi:hypothetical protein